MLEVHALYQKERINSERFAELLAYVSEEKRKRIESFIKWEDAQRTLLADILVRKIICAKCNLKNSDIRFGQNDYGKPYLKNVSHFYFNCAHSGDWVVCVVCSQKVGIDVEKIKPTDFAIAKRFFSPEEYLCLLDRKENQRLDFFYDLWTLKESYIKAVGKGLSLSLNDFTMRNDQGVFFLRDQTGNTPYTFKQYSVDPNYKVSVCVLGRITSDTLLIKTANELLDK